MFGHSWYQSNTAALTYSFWAGLTEPPVPIKADRFLKKRYPDSKLIIEEPESFMPGLPLSKALKDLADSGAMGLMQASNFSNVWSQILSISRGLAILRRDPELESFDFVVLTRFDAVITSFPNFRTLKADSLYLSSIVKGFPDIIMVGVADRVFATDALEICSAGEINEHQVNPENLKMSAYLKKYPLESVKQIGLNALPLRSGKVSKSLWLLFSTLVKTKLIISASKIFQGIRKNLPKAFQGGK